ncbi:MAG TPA: hypothetical protein VKG23_14285, partial [Thermoanaerobaculia bacterium]|nr:hypothetical protein [Thermoanaerobaculia bacterium]
MIRRPTVPRALRLGVLVLALGPTLARAGVNSWTSAGPFFGSLTALVADPTNSDVLYAAAYGVGVFRSADGGATWRAVNHGLQDLLVTSLAIDPSQTSTIYAGTNYRFVNRSVDSGGHWESQYSDGGTTDSITSLVVAPSRPGTIYAGSNAGVVRRTTDGGCSWGDPGVGLPSDGIVALAVDPSNPDVVYAGTPFHQAYKSVDGGATWSPQAAGLVYPAVYSFAIDPTDSQTLYAATSFFSEVDGSQGGGMFKTYDGGDNWFPLANALPNRAYRSVQIAPANPAVAYAAALGGGVFRTANAGVTWSPRNTGLLDSNGSGLAVTGDGTTLFAAMAAGVFRSTDSAMQWAYSSEDLPLFLGSALAVDPAAAQTVYAAGRVPGAAVCRSDDGGASWTVAAAGLPSSALASSLAINPTDSTNLYAGTDNAGVFRSDDDGNTWSATAPLVASGLTSVLALTVDPFTPTTVYASTVSGFFRTEDGGTSWTQSVTEPVLAAVADRSTEGRLVGSLNGTVEQSVDFGDTWEPSDVGIETVVAYVLAQSSSDPLVFLLGSYADPYGGTSAVYRSSDGGATWTPAAGIPQSAYLYAAAFAFDPLDGTVVYALLGPGSTPSDAGVYRSTDAGATWT